MAHAICLQDWITVSGNNSGTLVQPESDYLRLPNFQDVVVYAEVSSITNAGTTTLDIQSSPTCDEAFFAASLSSNPYLLRFSLTSASSGVQTLKVSRWASATDQLLAEYVRWKLSFPGTGGPTNITFRIWLSLNQSGWRR